MGTRWLIDRFETRAINSFSYIKKPTFFKEKKRWVTEQGKKKKDREVRRAPVRVLFELATSQAVLRKRRGRRKGLVRHASALT